MRTEAHIEEPLGDAGGLGKGRVELFTHDSPAPAATMSLDTAALIQVRPDVDPRIMQLYEEGVRLRQFADARVIAADDDHHSLSLQPPPPTTT